MLLRKRCQVICVEIAQRKTEIARRFGLEVVDGRGDVRKTLAGKRIDLCVDAAGATSPTFNLGLSLLRKEGTLLCVSQRHRFEMEFPPLGYRELTIKGVFGQCPEDFRKAVEITGAEPWPPAMITARYKLEDFGAALQAACQGENLKVVVLCSG
jgi:threonine dehydrogenase-like Zn-dependent dehydrogenase